MEGFIRGMRQFVSWSHLEQLLSLIHQIELVVDLEPRLRKQFILKTVDFAKKKLWNDIYLFFRLL